MSELCLLGVQKEKTIQQPKKGNRMAAIAQAIAEGTDLFDKTMVEVSDKLAPSSNVKEQKFWLGGVRRFVNAMNENGFEIVKKS